MTLPRVTPLKQYSPLDVMTTPSRTKKKFIGRFVSHAIGIECAPDLCSQRFAIQSDIETDPARTPVESIEMLIQKQQHALVQTQSFPYAVADDKAAVEYQYFHLLTPDELTVQIDERIRVAWIGGEVMTSGPLYLRAESIAKRHPRP
jgi:hypothetical protein